MTEKQLPGVYAPDGSLYITLTDGNGNLVNRKLITEENAVEETITPDHTLIIYDASGTAYKIPAVAAT